jgi:hypothetical protein
VAASFIFILFFLYTFITAVSGGLGVFLPCKKLNSLLRQKPFHNLKMEKVSKIYSFLFSDNAFKVKAE